MGVVLQGKLLWALVGTMLEMAEGCVLQNGSTKVEVIHTIGQGSPNMAT